MQKRGQNPLTCPRLSYILALVATRRGGVSTPPHLDLVPLVPLVPQVPVPKSP